MEALTPASPDGLPALGELVADEPFRRYRIGMAAEGVAHLRVWLTTGTQAGHLAVVTETGTKVPVAQSAEQIRAELTRRYGLSSCCSSIVLLPRRKRAPRPWTWSASAGMAARTGCVSGRHRMRIPAMPGLSCGWPFTGTRSSAGPRAGSIGAEMRRADHLITRRRRNVSTRCYRPFMDIGVIVYTTELEAPSLRETARRILKAEAARFGVPLSRAEVLHRRARGGSPMHVMAAADELVRHLGAAPDPLGADSPLMILARAGALALVSRAELDGNL